MGKVANDISASWFILPDMFKVLIFNVLTRQNLSLIKSNCLLLMVSFQYLQGHAFLQVFPSIYCDN